MFHFKISHIYILTPFLHKNKKLDIGMACSFTTTVHNPLDFQEQPPEKITTLKIPYP